MRNLKKHGFFKGGRACSTLASEHRQQQDPLGQSVVRNAGTERDPPQPCADSSYTQGVRIPSELRDREGIFFV